MSVRLVPAPLTLAFSQVSENDELYEREYQLLSGVDDDAIGQWIKHAKAKGDTYDTDKILLQLLVELHRKVDSLERLIKDEKPERISLAESSHIEGINFDGFRLKAGLFQEGSLYYGRITMPVYPQRDIGLFLEATSPEDAKIMRMHERDVTEWNAYVTARERIMIRDMKGHV